MPQRISFKFEEVIPATVTAETEHTTTVTETRERLTEIFKHSPPFYLLADEENGKYVNFRWASPHHNKGKVLKSMRQFLAWRQEDWPDFSFDEHAPEKAEIEIRHPSAPPEFWAVVFADSPNYGSVVGKYDSPNKAWESIRHSRVAASTHRVVKLHPSAHDADRVTLDDSDGGAVAAI